MHMICRPMSAVYSLRYTWPKYRLQAYSFDKIKPKVFRVSKHKAKQSSRAYIGAGCTSTMPITCKSKHNMYIVHRDRIQACTHKNQCGKSWSCFNRSRVSNISRVSNTSRGSEAFVQIEAGGFYQKFYGSLTFLAMTSFATVLFSLDFLLVTTVVCQLLTSVVNCVLLGVADIDNETSSAVQGIRLGAAIVCPLPTAHQQVSPQHFFTYSFLVNLI